MNKVAIISGASGGIGMAIASELSQAGYNLVLNYRTQSEALSQLASSLKTETLLIQGDVADFQDAENIVKAALDTFGRVDLLVNNAGITKDSLILNMSAEAFESVLKTNLTGTFHLTKHVSRTMLKQRSGKIINIASVVGITGNAGQSNYAASKAGVIGFTKSIARELASRGITVNAIAPGFIQTHMTDVISDEAKAAALSNIPLGYLGKPSDVAHAVAFLASDHANYITGQVIQVDGGMAM